MEGRMRESRQSRRQIKALVSARRDHVREMAVTRSMERISLRMGREDPRRGSLFKDGLRRLLAKFEGIEDRLGVVSCLDTLSWYYAAKKPEIVTDAMATFSEYSGMRGPGKLVASLISMNHGNESFVLRHLRLEGIVDRIVRISEIKDPHIRYQTARAELYAHASLERKLELLRPTQRH